MTRINCVPVSELTSKHLVAEYRELPRVFGLVRKYQERGGRPDSIATHGQPASYVLGRGHVLFFYTRLLWLSWRHVYLVNEMVSRGYNPNFRENLRVTYGDLSTWWWNDWEPTPEAMRINRARIQERLNGR